MIAEKDLASYIDHTILNADATVADIDAKCREAKEYNFASVCVNPFFVTRVKEELKDSEVKVCTVVGFPLGENTLESKVFETKDAIKKGADEIDMVLNIGAVKSGLWEIVKEEIEAVVKASQDKLVKVIIETCYLTAEEKEKLCQIIGQAGADYIKTSTGFGSEGAKAEDIKLFKATTPGLKIKASGGIREKAKALQMIKAGADRLGVSSGVAIITGEQGDNNY